MALDWKPATWAALVILGVALWQPAAPPAHAQAGDADALKKRIEQLYSEKKYEEGLALERQQAAETERSETASAGKPGMQTAGALGGLAWHAVLGQKFDEALAAADRAQALAPDRLWIKANRAHALLFSGRAEEARTIYLAYKGKPISSNSQDSWDDLVADDFEIMRKAGLTHPMFAEIEKAFGINSEVSREEIKKLTAQIRQLHDAGKYAEAVPIAQKNIELTRARYGEDSVNYADAISWLARLDRFLGRYSEAQPLFERALATTEKALGPEHKDVASRLGNLAQIYQDQGDYKRAEPLFVRALAIRQKALGPDHVDVGQALNNLAVLYDDQGRYAEAETLYKQALTITEKALGPDHIEVGTYLSNLAGVYKAQGRYAEAEPLLKRALAISEKKLGPDHPSVAYRLNNLAVVYRAQGRYPEAEAYYKRSLAIFEKSLGPDHRNVGQLLNNLAVLYNLQGRYAESEPLMKRAMSITEKALGPKHPDMVLRLNNLAWVYEKQGRLKDAEQLYRRSLAIGEAALGPDHPDVINSRENLAGLYKSGGRLTEAEPLLREVLAAKEKRFGKDHPSVAASLTQLGDLYRLEGKCEQADPLFVRALAVSKGELKEVPVLFATDRKRDSKQKAIAFGSERDSQISLGLADVTIPEETKGRSEQQPAEHKPAPAGKKEGAASETGSERRLAMRCIQIVKDAQIIELASRRLAVSKTYPNQVLVFVHGYNVSFDNAVRRAAQIAYDLKFDGGTFLFSWPSRGQWDPRAYFSDSDTVDIAAEHLRQFLETIVAKTKTPRINFIAHSMGNLVLLRALDKIGSEYPDLRKAVGEIIDAAPDVDTDVFKQLVPKVIAMGGRFTLYASANDRALWLSGLLRNGSRAGFISANRPLIVAGVDTIDISQAGTGLFALNHDVYTASPSIIEDMRRVFELGTRPPDQRTKDFEKMTSKDGAYWRLKASVPTAQ